MNRYKLKLMLMFYLFARNDSNPMNKQVHRYTWRKKNVLVCEIQIVYFITSRNHEFVLVTNRERKLNIRKEQL